jgi:hypothetical protein
MPKNLLVPGTGGNKLLLDGADLGWPSVLAAQGRLAGLTGYALGLDGLPISAADLTSLLSMEFADAASVKPTRTTLRAGSAITAGPLLEAVYNQFLSYDRFFYDFRSDLRDSGERLLTHLIDQRPADDRWRIVCHSQGGLLVTCASKLYARRNGDDDRAFAKLVSHVAFVGVPFYGTVNAAVALLSGEALSAGFADSFKKVARTWPSLHQMLPVWRGSVRLRDGTGALVPAPFSAMDPRAWPGADVAPAMLARARETRASFLDSPLSRMNGVKKRILMSRAYPTGNHLIVDGGATTVGLPDERGDSLVPAETTYRTEAAVERDVTHQFGGDGDTLRHFALCVDPFVAAEVQSFFGQ